MNATEIGTVGFFAIVILVILVVTLKNRNGNPQPRILIKSAQQNLSYNLRLPSISDPEKLKIVPIGSHVLVFRSHMQDYRDANNAFGFTKTLWQMPYVEDPNAKLPKVPKNQYAQALKQLFPTRGGLQSLSDAFIKPPNPQSANRPPAQGPLQILPWPPLASAQLVTQYPDPSKAPGTNNALQQNGTSVFQPVAPNAPPLPSVGVSVPNWNSTSLPSTAYRQYPLNDVVKDGKIIEKRAFVRVAGISDPEGANAYNVVNGTSTMLTALSLQFEQEGYVQVECAGGKGGYFLTGSKQDKNLIQQVGGNNGIVWAIIKVKAGDSWQVQLSQNGGVQSRNVSDIEANVTSFNSEPSGGGYGSFLSGSEGGGATWISTRNPCLTSENPNNCPEQGKSHETVLMVAGGGGGASRNSYGGNAGCSLIGAQVEAVNPNPQTGSNVHLFNEVHPNPIFQGFPGGPTNIPDPTSQLTPPVQTSLISNLSGGGGGYTNSTEGQSWNAVDLQFVPKELRGPAKKQSHGKPLQGGQGTDDPPGGGGGGAGWKGGGAGIWNQLAAPNNIHGAGGGGSSQIDSSIQYLSSSSTQLKIVNQNPQYTKSWKSEPPIFNKAFTNDAALVFEPTNYFLLGLPVQS